MVEILASRFAGMNDLLACYSGSFSAALVGGTEVSFSDEAWCILKGQVQRCIQFCKDLSLPFTAEAFRQLDVNLDRNLLTWPNDAAFYFKAARMSLQNELINRRMVMIETRKSEMLDGCDPLLRDRLCRKYFEFINDIDNAFKCLSLNQGTACVFHLMRCMELTVQKFANMVGADFDPTKDTWDTVIKNINSSLRLFPRKNIEQRIRHDAFSQASGHLNTLRIAWRNEVMHPKRDYSTDEAEQCLMAIRAFLIDFADFV